MSDAAPGIPGDHVAPAGLPAPASAVDAAALARIVDRRQRIDDSPWLHTEVARRMASRLALFAVQPRCILQWWGPRAGDEGLRAAYPGAQLRVAVPAQTAGVGAHRPSDAPADRSWWQRLGRRSPTDAVPTWSDASLPGATAQLLWANMVMHAAPDMSRLLRRWHAVLEVGGTLMFSTFGPDTLRELRQLYRSEGWGPPGVEPIDMHDVGDALVHAGFADPVMDQERLTLHWPSPQALVDELRGLGGNASTQRHPGLRTPRWRQRLHDALRGCAVDGRIALTFEIVYGHAFKVHRAESGSTPIALDDVVAGLPSRRRARGGR